MGNESTCCCSCKNSKECINDKKDKNIQEIIRGKNVNFLFGSGLTSELYGTLKLEDDSYKTQKSEDDLCETQKSEDDASFDFNLEDLWSSEEIDNQEKSVIENYFYINYIFKMFMSHLNVENGKTFELKENIKKFIGFLHNFMINEGFQKPKRVNIFTTNYDLMLEISLDEFLKENQLLFVNYGTKGLFKKYLSTANFHLNISHSGTFDNFRRDIPTINLIKFHGSISFVEENENLLKVHDCIHLLFQNRFKKIQFDADQFIKKIKNKFDSIKKDLKDKDKNTHIKIQDFIEQFKTRNIAKEFLDFETKDEIKDILSFLKKLQIVKPNKDKFSLTLRQHYFQLIRLFSYELEKENTILIVFGFSFGDEHISEIFQRSLSNDSLYVYIFCHSKNDEATIKKNIKWQNLENSKKIQFIVPEAKENINFDNFLKKYLKSSDNEKVLNEMK